MSETRKKADWPTIAALVVAGMLVVALGVYVGGYFALSTRIIDYGYDGAVVRCFDARWKARVYGPAASAEGAIIRHRVRAEFDPSISSGS